MKLLRPLYFGIMILAAQAPPVMGAVNIALGSTPSASGPGWGLGSNISDIVDGHQYYVDTNAHGLALPWTNSGIQWVELDFGAVHSFDTVTVWHHFTNRIPPEAMLEYWDGGGWNNIDFSRSFPVIEYDGVPGNSASDEYTFLTVSGSKIRWSYDSAIMYAATGQHAWIYEMEVFSPVPEPSTITIFGLGGLALTAVHRGRGRRKNRLSPA